MYSNKNMYSMKQSWHLSWQGWFGLLGLGLVGWLIVTYASLIMEVVWILFGAFLLSLAIRPLADTLARQRIPRSATVLVVYVGLIGLFAILGTLLVPIINTETTLLQTNGPNLLQTALSRLAATPVVGYLIPSGNTLSQSLIQYLYALGPTFLSTVAGVTDAVLNLIVVLILAFFLTTDATMGQQLLHSFVPIRYHSQVSTMIGRVRERLTRWIWAQVSVALYFALTFGVGLTWLGVPFALTIALVGGVLEIIPYVGGVVAVLLAILSALTVTPWLAVWVILLWAIVVEVQGHIVAPIFYGRAMHLHPAIILVALLIGVKVKGVMGIFFAIPVAVVLLTLWQEIQAASLAKSPTAPVEGRETTPEIADWGEATDSNSLTSLPQSLMSTKPE